MHKDKIKSPLSCWDPGTELPLKFHEKLRIVQVAGIPAVGAGSRGMSWKVIRNHVSCANTKDSRSCVVQANTISPVHGLLISSREIRNLLRRKAPLNLP